MSGYAAAARIERATPRLVRSLAAEARPGDRWPAAVVETAVPAEPVDARIQDPLVERWAAFCDRWKQLTFFLFDAEGWR